MRLGEMLIERRLITGEDLERALELKSASEEVSVTAIAVAPGCAMESLHRARALGADGAALIKTDSLPDNPHDTARLVADLAGGKPDGWRPP